MRTQRVNNTEKNNTKVIAAGVAGGAAAAAVGRVLPLSHFEHDRAFTKDVISNIKKVAQTARADEFTKIGGEIAATSNLKNVGDVFVKNKDAIIEGSQDKIKTLTEGLDESAKNVFNNLAKRVSDSGDNAKALLSKDVVKQAKKSRPLVYFAALGAIGAMTLAVVKNAINARKAEKEKVAINYEDDGSMTIDAPDNMSLAILLDQTV